jgi:hypothetical protein
VLVALLALSTPLLAGVHEIAAPGVPGPLVVFGERAEVVVAGKQGRCLEPVVATATFGKGRVAAFGHGGYFGSGAMGTGQTRRLLVNSVRWANIKPGIVGVHRASDMESVLKEVGLESKRLSELDLGSLDGISLLVIDPNGESARYAPVIQKFVQDGGGLLIAGLGWGWLQLHSGKTIHEHPCNLITLPMGIAWADGYLDRNSRFGFLASQGPSATHAGKAIVSITDPSLGPQVSQTLTRAIATLGRHHTFIIDLESRLAQVPVAVPSEKSPLRLADAGARIAHALSLQGNTKPHPAADSFPGLPNGSVKLTSRTVRIDPRRPRWHSTGAYALPGTSVRIVTTSAAEQHGLRIRIGAHSDTLWHLDEWKRAPEVSVSVPVKGTDFHVAGAFGGLIYVEVPETAKGDPIAVRFDNVIEAPHYVLGKTTDEEWLENRHHPAPWTEMESSKIVLTVPSEFVRKLDDPKRLMNFWDRVADACADFAAIPRDRKYAERFVADVQISAGYMHAGYPIMTHLDAAPRMVDYQYLTDIVKGGDWGMFHEIGHNHQESDWTFEGTGEVTNNLFTLYIIDTVVGKRPAYHVRWTDQQLLEIYRKHRATGANFEKWKADPFLALAMYVQLQQAFGWEPFKRVFAEYRILKQDERPKNDAEKRDQWMVRLSRAVGKNLGPFFDAWGIPTSNQAKASLKDLPVWGFPR